MVDPPQTNVITLNAAMDIPYLMGAFNLQWTNLGLGFPLTFTFSDDLDTTRTLSSDVIRNTVFSLEGSYSHGLGREDLRFTVAPRFEAKLSAPEAADEPSAYYWTYDLPLYMWGPWGWA